MKTEPRRRDAEETRLKILESARCVFTEKGYERAGLREISRNAGVDQALIKRYFGSKLKLFEAVFDTGVGIHLVLLGPKESIGQALATYYLGKQRDAKGFDATMALLNSIGSAEVNQHMKHIVETQFIDRLAGHIGGRAAEQRSALIISHVLGFDVLRRVLGVDSLGPKHDKEIVRSWGRQIQSLVNDE